MGGRREQRPDRTLCRERRERLRFSACEPDLSRRPKKGEEDQREKSGSHDEHGEYPITWGAFACQIEIDEI